MSYSDQDPQERRQDRQKLALSISGDLYDIILKQSQHLGVGLHEHIEFLLKRATNREARLSLPSTPHSRSLTMALLLTKNQMAAELGLSVSTIWRLCKRGVIPYLRIGRRIRFQADKVIEALERSQRFTPHSALERLRQRKAR